jgi:hypothetical protein
MSWFIPQVGNHWTAALESEVKLMSVTLQYLGLYIRCRDNILIPAPPVLLLYEPEQKLMWSLQWPHVKGNSIGLTSCPQTTKITYTGNESFPRQ